MKSRIILYVCVLFYIYSCNSVETPPTLPDMLVLVGSEQQAVDFGFIKSEHAQTPFLDELAANGFIFTNGYFLSDDRRANIRSILHGISPMRYRSELDSLMKSYLMRMSFVSQEDIARWQDNFLSEQLRQYPTMPRELTEKGYEATFIGPESSIYPKAAGFDKIIEFNTNYVPSRDGDLIVKAFHEFAQSKSPQFVFLVTPTLSEQYIKSFSTPSETVDSTTQAQQYFAHCTAYDLFYNKIFNLFKQTRPAAERISVFIQSSGKRDANDLAFRSPVIFHTESIRPAASKALVQSTDIFPTLMDLIDAQIPESLTGLSLEEVLKGQKEKVRNSVVGNFSDGYFIRNHNIFFITDTELKTHRLYELSQDPYCRDNMIDYHPAKTKRYVSELETLMGE